MNFNSKNNANTKNDIENESISLYNSNKIEIENIIKNLKAQTKII